MSPKINNIGVGTHGHVPKSENLENDGFSVLPEMSPKGNYSQLKQNNSTELLGYSFNTSSNKQKQNMTNVP